MKTFLAIATQKLDYGMFMDQSVDYVKKLEGRIFVTRLDDRQAVVTVPEESYNKAVLQFRRFNHKIFEAK